MPRVEMMEQRTGYCLGPRREESKDEMRTLRTEIEKS